MDGGFYWVWFIYLRLLRIIQNKDDLTIHYINYRGYLYLSPGQLFYLSHEFICVIILNFYFVQYVAIVR